MNTSCLKCKWVPPSADHNEESYGTFQTYRWLKIAASAESTRVNEQMPFINVSSAAFKIAEKQSIAWFVL